MVTDLLDQLFCIHRFYHLLSLHGASGAPKRAQTYQLLCTGGFGRLQAFQNHQRIMPVKNRTYTVGAFAFDRAVLSFVGVWFFREERGKTTHKIKMYHAAAGRIRSKRGPPRKPCKEEVKASVLRLTIYEQVFVDYRWMTRA